MQSSVTMRELQKTSVTGISCGDLAVGGMRKRMSAFESSGCLIARTDRAMFGRALVTCINSASFDRRIFLRMSSRTWFGKVADATRKGTFLAKRPQRRPRFA